MMAPNRRYELSTEFRTPSHFRRDSNSSNGGRIGGQLDFSAAGRQRRHRSDWLDRHVDLRVGTHLAWT